MNLRRARMISAFIVLCGAAGADNPVWRSAYLVAATCSNKYLLLYATKTNEPASSLAIPVRQKCRAEWALLRDRLHQGARTLEEVQRANSTMAGIVEAYDEAATVNVLDWRAGALPPPQ